MGRHAVPKDSRHGVSRRTVAVLAVSGTLGTGAALAATTEAHSASAGTVWDRLARCESSGDFHNRDTGRNGHYGGFQFSLSTWHSVGGSGNPADASVAEQLKRAKILLARSGPGQWECKVGLTKTNGAAQGLTVLKGTAAPVAARTVPSGRLPNLSAARAVAFARAQLGKPYVFGGTGPRSFDCSGLVQAAWKAAGVSIPRTSQTQAAGLVRVPVSRIQAGDIVVYRPGNAHVGIYIGGGKIIEAARPGTVVRTAPYRTGWYADNFRFVVRPAGVGPVVDPNTGVVSNPPIRATAARVHTVVRGETLFSIAAGAHVKGGWPALYKANRAVIGHDPDLIHPGQRLTLPR